MRALVLPLICVAACSPAVQSATYVPGAVPAQVSSAAGVRIYDHTRPGCAFEEIGWVGGSPRVRGNSPDDVLNAMRERARAMGGHAIIGLSSSERTDAVMVTGEAPAATVPVASSNVFRGTVVRFTNPGCVA